ncbi:MAG: OsmC family protein, partial [Pacificimonas sp.]
VGIENASDIFIAAKHPKSFISLDDSDHLMTSDRDTSYAVGVMTSWVERYIEPRPVEDDPAHEDVVVEPAGGAFKQVVTAAGHRSIADEPRSIGGTDEGPTPYGLLLGALGTCTNMTVQLIAKKEKIPLGSVTTRLSHGRRYDTDCEGCMDSPKRIETINREISFVGSDLTEDHRARLLEIADKCPVHKTLAGEVGITTNEVMELD